MNEYFTPPDAPASGARARSALIKEIIDAIDDAFDNIPEGLTASIADLYEKWVDEIGLPTLVNGKYLTNDGTDLEWDDPLPDQGSNSGKVLQTDGTDAAWELKYPDQSGKSGYTLQSDGTDAGWYYRPRSGSIELTADGTVTAGDLIVLNSDGTGSSGATTVLASDTPVLFSTGVTTYISSCYNTDNDKVVFAYASGGVGYAVVGNISSGAISFPGTATMFSTEAAYIDCCYDTTNNVVVIVYRKTSGTKYGYARLGTVSGTEISFGAAEVAFSSSEVNHIRCCFDSTNERVAIFYSDAGSSDTLYGIVGDASGANIEFGTAVSGTYPDISSIACCFDPDFGKIVVGHSYTYLTLPRPTGMIAAINNADDSISFEVGVDIRHVGNAGYVLGCDYDTANDQVVFLIREDADDYYNCVLCSVITGTSLNVEDSAETDFTGSGTAWGQGDCVYNPDTGQMVCFAQYGTNLCVFTCIVSGGGITIETEYVLVSSATKYISAAYSTVDDVMVIGYQNDGATGDKGNAIIYDYSSTTYEWAGVAQTAATDGNSFTMTTIGGINTQQTGLTPGVDYYADVDGEITTAITPYGKVGRAITATSILVTKGGAE